MPIAKNKPKRKTATELLEKSDEELIVPSSCALPLAPGNAAAVPAGTDAAEVASANLTSGLSMALSTANFAGESPDNLWETDLGLAYLSPTASPAPQGEAATPKEIIVIDDSAPSPTLDSSAVNLMPVTPVSQVNLLETPGAAAAAAAASAAASAAAAAAAAA